MKIWIVLSQKNNRAHPFTTLEKAERAREIYWEADKNKLIGGNSCPYYVIETTVDEEPVHPELVRLRQQFAEVMQVIAEQEKLYSILQQKILKWENDEKSQTGH